MKRLLTALICIISSLSTTRAGERDTVSFLFIGDVMAHYRQLQFALRSDGDSLKWDDYDFSSYFKHVKPLMDKADFTVANMESVYGVLPYTGYPCFSAPKSLAKEAFDSGVDLFLCANNHIGDKGLRGLDSTYSIYSDLGVLFTGLRKKGDNLANNPLIVDIKGFKVAFVNFTYDTNGYDIPEPYIVNQMDTALVKEALMEARRRGADYTIVLPHWGTEYDLDCNAKQQRWAFLLIRWGADAIVGSHPHVVQGTTFDDAHPVAYSLGNFVSNMSVATSQIGMIYRFSIVRSAEGTVKALAPRVTYTWCGRGGMMEANYTVVPIEDYIDHPEAFIEREQYDKMSSDWKVIREKFNL